MENENIKKMLDESVKGTSLYWVYNELGKQYQLVHPYVGTFGMYADDYKQVVIRTALHDQQYFVDANIRDTKKEVERLEKVPEELPKLIKEAEEHVAFLENPSIFTKFFELVKIKNEAVRLEQIRGMKGVIEKYEIELKECEELKGKYISDIVKLEEERDNLHQVSMEAETLAKQLDPSLGFRRKLSIMNY